MPARSPLYALLVLVMSLVLACGGDPLADDAADYTEAMGKPLSDNMALAQEFLEVAAEVKRGNVDADDIHARWEKRVLPLADQLYDEVQAIEPSTPELAGLHQQLVDAWGDRAEAYHSMHRAYEKADANAYQAAFDKNVESKLAEEDYFGKVNRLLEPYGYHLDQFP